MNHTPEERLHRILETGHKLLDYLEEKQITPEQVQKDYTVQWTITTPLYNIGEQTYQLAKEWKEKYPEIPWSQISGIRHRLVHNYEDTNWEIICIVLFEELEKFCISLRKYGKMNNIKTALPWSKTSITKAVFLSLTSYLSFLPQFLFERLFLLI